MTGPRRWALSQELFTRGQAREWTRKLLKRIKFMAIRVAGATFRAFGRRDGQRLRLHRLRVREKRNTPSRRAIANLFDSLRGGLRCAAISPSREMTYDDTGQYEINILKIASDSLRNTALIDVALCNAIVNFSKVAPPCFVYQSFMYLLVRLDY